METLQILLTSLISFLGFLGGIILYFLVKEEVTQGRQYINLFAASIILMFSAYLFNGLGVILPIRILLYLILIAGLAFVKIPVFLIYPVLGLGLALSSSKGSLFFTETALIFTYGLAVGSLAALSAKRTGYGKSQQFAESLLAMAKNGLFFLPILIALLAF